MMHREVFNPKVLKHIKMKNLIEIGLLVTFMFLLILDLKMSIVVADLMSNLFVMLPFTFMAVRFFRNSTLFTLNGVLSIFYVSLSYLAILFIFKQYPGVNVLKSTVIIIMIGAVLGSLFKLGITKTNAVRFYIYFQIMVLCDAFLRN